MTAPRVRLAALTASVAVAGCLEISSPSSDIESISTVISAYPAAVMGDSLRDSLGVAQPFQLLAFTGRGDTVQSPEALRWFLPDTGVDATVTDGQFIAGTRLGVVRVFGQIGTLQTPPETVHVVAQPIRTLPTSPATIATLQYSADQPTTTSAPLEVRVQGDTAGVAVDLTGWVVSYRIVRQPARNPLITTGVPAFFGSTQSRTPRTDSTVAADTTSSGIASRTVVVSPAFLESFELVDTVEVQATVLYRGAHVPGSPVTFRVPIAPRP